MSVARFGIRTRIAGGSFVIALVICVGVGLILNLRVEQILRNGTEAVLASSAAPFAEAIRTEPTEIFDAPGPGQLIAVIEPDGTMPVDTLPTGVAAAVRADGFMPGTREYAAPEGGFIVHVDAVASPRGGWSVVSARPVRDERDVLAKMRVLIFATLAAIAAGVLLTALLLTSASLRPVRRIRQTAERLIDTSGDDVLPIGPADDEIARLARTLNELIGELRASAQRERQLVSDASHELRTPLAILRTRLELARAQPHTVDQLLADIRSAEHSAVRLAGLVDSLLQLSAIEAAGPAASRAEDLVDEVRDAIGRAEFRDHGSGVEIREDISVSVEQAVFGVRAEDFGRIVENLLSNALRAVAGDGRVTVRMRSGLRSLILRVEDTGGGMPEEFVGRAFDRFSQDDATRTGGTGAGLGLSIVAAIVKRSDGSIRLENRRGAGLAVVIELPARTDGGVRDRRREILKGDGPESV